MASSGPSNYDTADVELFDVDKLTNTSDQRSVGELVFDVDRQARLLLIDVTEDDAAPLLTAWPTLVSAAADLWQALPHVPGPPTTTASAIERVTQISDGTATRLTISPWPPSTAPDPRVMEMANTLGQAASLVRRFADRTPVSDSAREDLHAARARIMHSVYVATHAVTVSLVQHGRTRRDQAAASGRPLATPARQTPYAVAPTTEWVRRMSAAEAAAASFAPYGRLAVLLNGEQPAPAQITSRLAGALARWDVEAHRGLVSSDWRDNMVLITRTQALVTGTAMVLIAAAAAGGKHDLSPRLRPALDRAGAAWNDLGSRWDDLTPANVRPSPQLMRAAGEIRAAARSLTHDGATLAAPHTVAARPGLHDGLEAVLHALEHADELAHAVADKGTAPGLTGHARALSLRAHNDIEAGRFDAPEGDVVWVSPTDILSKQMVAAPPPVIGGLRAAGAALVQAVSLAGSVASSSQSALMNAQRDRSSLAAAVRRQTKEHPLSTGCTDRPESGRPRR